jgi:hypothetical protein
VHGTEAGAAVGQLAVGAVDIAPLFGDRDNGLTFPVQDRVQRHLQAGLGVLEAAEAGTDLPAQQPRVIQAERGRRAPQGEVILGKGFGDMQRVWLVGWWVRGFGFLRGVRGGGVILYAVTC